MDFVQRMKRALQRGRSATLPPGRLKLRQISKTGLIDVELCNMLIGEGVPSVFAVRCVCINIHEVLPLATIFYLLLECSSIVLLLSQHASLPCIRSHIQIPMKPATFYFPMSCRIRSGESITLVQYSCM